MRLDLGCGKAKKEGYVGVDRIAFPGVDQVLDIGKDRWPFDDNSVDEAHCSHTLEHLTVDERYWFFNELYRVLKPRGTCQIIVPHFQAARYWGDPTHQPHPISEWTWLYLNKAWREEQAPHVQRYTCDFDAGYGYSLHPAWIPRHQEAQQFAMQWYAEARQDMIATLTSRKTG